MSSLAFVFPGQGSQAVGMGRALAAVSPAAAAVFAQADEALGENLARLAWEGPAEELDLTANAQPALLATSIAFLRALEEHRTAAGRALLVPAFAAGHSMGQYSALVAAGVVSFGDGMRLVRERGRLMQASGEGHPGAMAAIIGLPDERLDDLVAAGAALGTFGVANRNSPGQVVVSGVRPAVEAAAAAAKGLGAKRAIVLPVSVAAHSPLMREAAQKFAGAVAATPFRTARVPVVANVTAQPIVSVEEIRAELVQQLTSSVRWTQSVSFMTTQGVSQFVEVGPKDVLAGLIRRIAPQASATSVGDVKTLETIWEQI